MFLYVLSCTVMVQGGTRWYKVVHDGTRNGIWRYMEVHGSTRICKTVHTGMYWNILILTVQLESGSSWTRNRCCNAAAGAVLKTSASNHSNASSSMFQSRSLGLATASAGTPPPGRRRWRRRSGGGCCGFRRRRRCSRRNW